MIIFYYGTDGYRLDKGVADAVASFQNKFKSGFNLYRIDLSEKESFSSVEDAVKTVSFFDEKKLLVLKNTFSSKTAAQELEELIEKFDLLTNEPLVLLIKENLSEKELQTKSKTLFKVLNSEKNKVKTFDALSGAQLSSWIKTEVAERGATIDPAASAQLVGYIGTDTHSLANEIYKLSGYKNGGMITTADVELLVKPKITNNIFDLVDAIASRNKPRAYELLYSQLMSDANPGYILTMIIYQFRNLLMVKDFTGGSAAAAKTLGMHPYVAQKSMHQAQAFDLAMLKKIYGQLLAMDTGYKRGVSDLELDLNKLVLTI
jgi:DNA polymerase III subunit delta